MELINKSILVIIPARGGSKGIPRKNIRSLDGKPLIYYSIRNALQIKAREVDCYLSSEDDEILTLAKKFGSKIHKRSSENAHDATTLDPVIHEAYHQILNLENKEYDLVITPSTHLSTFGRQVFTDGNRIFGKE